MSNDATVAALAGEIVNPNGTNNNDKANSNALTAEQQLQLEQARAARTAAEARAAELDVERKRLDGQNVALKFQTNFADGCKESECDFYLPPAQLLKLLDGTPDAAGISISQGADGRVLAEKDGQRVALKDALRSYAASHPEMVKNAVTLLTDANLVQSRSQFKTDAAKVAFIAANGLAAYERLPQHPVSKADIGRMTGAEWKALTAQQKCALIAAGANVAEIVRRRG